MKVVKTVFSLFLLFLLLQFFITFFIKDKKNTYMIKGEKEKYEIKEIYHNKKYHIEIKDKKKRTFHFLVSYNYNKQEKIIKGIKEYKKDNLICLSPILRKEKESSISCFDGEKEFTDQVLKEEDSKTYEEVIKKFHKSESLTTLQKYKDVTYSKEALKNRTFVVWSYDGIYYFSDKQVEKIKLFKKDQYENEYSIQVGNYYLIANSDEKHEFSKFYRINLKTGKQDTFSLETPISFDSYFLGVVDNLVYLFDKDSLKEYKINVKKKKIEVIGDKKKNGFFYDGEWKKRNIYDFRKDLKFSSPMDKEIKKQYKDFTILQGIDAYYMKKGNELWFVDPYFKDSKVLLITNKELKEITILQNTIYFIDHDSIYSYQRVKGLEKVITRREINFNYKNIYAVLEK